MGDWTAAHGQSLRRLRNEQGLSIATLAHEAGCSGSRIGELERAEAHGRPTGPSPELWSSLRTILGEDLPASQKTSHPAYRNRTLTQEELERLFNPLFHDMTTRIDSLADGDKELVWALRRKLSKELQYLERGKPMLRRAIKKKKWEEQDGKCAVCLLDLPEKNSVLDRLVAMDGYTVDNTRLLCPECDSAVQAKREYR